MIHLSNKNIKCIVAAILFILIAYLVSFTLVDANLMGKAKLRIDLRPISESYMIIDSTRVDPQTGFKCSAFSSAYVMRHFGNEVNGDSIYELMPEKMTDGYVYPKGILKFFKKENFKVAYNMGNIVSLKNSIAKGHPVIVMIKIQPDKDWLHYVPIVGYSPDSVYVAESIPELCNSRGPNYSRTISTEEFKVLWNTSSFKMPLYRNTFIEIVKP